MLEPNSLLVLKDEMYTKYLHGISERSEDVLSDKICNFQHLGVRRRQGTNLQRSTRISLTIRHVLKTHKIKIGLGTHAQK